MNKYYYVVPSDHKCDDTDFLIVFVDKYNQGDWKFYYSKTAALVCIQSDIEPIVTEPDITQYQENELVNLESDTNFYDPETLEYNFNAEVFINA